MVEVHLYCFDWQRLGGEKDAGCHASLGEVLCGLFCSGSRFVSIGSSQAMLLPHTP